MRCIGHVINLVVKAFVYGQDFMDTNDDTNSTENLDLYDQWRKRGPYGKLRNIITYISWTPQRRKEFAKITQEAQPEATAFQPIAANLTRWNSDFKALKRALQLQLRNRFEVFIARPCEMDCNMINLILMTGLSSKILSIFQNLSPMYAGTGRP